MHVRITPISPPYDAPVAEDLQKLMPPGVPPLALFRILANNPRVLRRLRRGGLLDPGSITLRQRELVILRTTARAGAEYEWGVHAAFFGPAARLEPTHLHATVWEPPEATCWSTEEQALLRACDELHASARIDDATWAELATHYSEPQLIEILMLAGQYRAVSYVVNAAGVPLEAAAPRFPAREVA